MTLLAGGRSTGRAMPNDDDFALMVSGLVHRSPTAAAQAFRRFAPLVNRVLRRILGTNDVEDEAQDVFLHLFRHVGSLRDPQALPAFVLTLATRTARWELRKRALRRMIQLSPTGETPEQPTDEPDWGSRQAVTAFYKILDGLRANDRTAFVLRFVEKMEMKDVATALGVSESTAKRRTSNAWQRVQARVSQEPALLGYAQRAVGLGREEDPHV